MATCTFWVFDIWTLFKSMYVALDDTALRQEGGCLLPPGGGRSSDFPLDLRWYLTGKGLLVTAGQI